MTIDEFITQIRKPLFVYNMSMHSEKTSQSAKKCCDKARKDIDALILKRIGGDVVK